ncbi:pentapeptide repeat-containing protein [Alkalihalobacillus trypoxylicola]|uniref:Oxetanocin A resistance protein n=1 Tax=Alkalihalobacillus trypoxylicola TaxID=519424 RepID=A0A162CQU9_9BACI|nr:pentapeptide repeat-containing protein [Alkalihalobacillus trypoxylicola]KYG26061.1 hypothetical protein AZF04_13325 [Alkalihalobacillus trypoxylicola]
MKDSLKSDCLQCIGLCCVALPYSKSTDFPLDKKEGQQCTHLQENNRCGIHNQLRKKGFRGCVSYECFGAGQHVTQNLYKGLDWRRDTDIKDEMFTVFTKVQQMHEMLMYLEQALTLNENYEIHDKLQKVLKETATLVNHDPKDIMELNVSKHREKINPLLMETSLLYRENHKTKSIKISSFFGKSFNKKNFEGYDFRGKLLIAANFSGAQMSYADFIGADLRDTNLSGANLSGALFLTQSQINSAQGNQHTILPEYLDRPQHWCS